MKQRTLSSLFTLAEFDTLKFRDDIAGASNSSVEFRGSDMASSRLIEAAKTTDGTDITRGTPGWMRAGAFL